MMQQDRQTNIAEKGTKAINMVLRIVALLILLYSAFVLYDTIYANRAAFLSDDLSQYRPGLDENDKPNFEEIVGVNEDTRAWLAIKDTHIDYPVMQGKDDVEYSMKDVMGKNSLTGSIYLSAENKADFSDTYNIIYGHHMDNGAMFGDIEKYEDEGFFRAHQEGILITREGAYDLKIFARLNADAYDENIYKAGDLQPITFPQLLAYAQGRAVQWVPYASSEAFTRSIGVYVDARNENINENGSLDIQKMPEDAIRNGKQLLALSTCADAITNGRHILLAEMTIHEGPLPDWFGDKVPLAGFRRAWGHGESPHWALLNLVCVILSLLVVLPWRNTRRKYKDKETGIFGKNLDKRIRRTGIISFLIELVVAICSLILFFITEDIFSPMVIIDRWTLAMILIAAIGVAAELVNVRKIEKHRQEAPADGE